MLSIGGWLLDDLTHQGSEPARVSSEDLEPGLFTASFLWAMREQAIDSIADPTSFSDQRYLAFAQWCGDRAVVEIGRLIPVGDRFWVRFQEESTTGLELSIDDDVGQPMRGRWSSTAAATTLAAGRLAQADDEQVEAITDVVTHMCVAFQIWDEVSTFMRDLGQGRLTYPIAQIARTAGIPLQPMPDQLQILGAMVVTNGLKTVLDDASEHLAASRERARALNLPTLSGFLDDVAAADVNRRDQFIDGKSDVGGLGLAPPRRSSGSRRRRKRRSRWPKPFCCPT